MPVSAGNPKREQFRYVVEGPFEGIVIEGDVIDDETGEPVGGSGITGEVHSEITRVDVQADENGHFIVVVPMAGDHIYLLNVFAAGYDPVTVVGSVRSGERKYLQISIHYNPFDMQLSENSGNLERGYAATTYSGKRSIPFLAQRTVPALDSNGKPIHDTVEENVLTGYTWEERVIKYRAETASLSASAGDWVDTGDTYELWPLFSLPSLPSGYRWVYSGSGWISSFYKKQYNEVEYYSAQGYTVTPNYETCYRIETYQEWVSGHYESCQSWERVGTETYQEWVPGHNETRTRTYTSWSWEAVGGHWEWQWAWFMPYPVWVTDYGWVAHTYTTTYQEWVPGYYVTRTRDLYGWVTRQIWIDGHYETRTRQVPYQTIASYTATRQVPYEVWEARTSTTMPDIYLDVLGTRRDDMRNLGEVYTTTVRQEPRTRVETYTAYRIYDYGGTYYSFLPWESKQTTVVATPRNWYTGGVRLVVEAGDGVEASLGSSVLTFSSSASTTLTMSPSHASVHNVTVKAYDSNGRLVMTRTYELNTTESLPSGSYWESYVGTTSQPDVIPPTITSTSTTAQTLEPWRDFEIGQIEGQIYDGGTVGGPLTQFWTVDYMQTERQDGTLNYLNQEAWGLTYDLKIPGQIEPIPFN